jgi:sugar lactone lactonase YvrE
MHDTAWYVATLALITTSACTSASPTAGNSGSLTVTITAPPGTTPAVKVSGPGQYTKTLSTTTTLTHLAPGDYTLSASTVTLAGPIVSTVNTATITGSPATVSEATTASVTATYAVRSGTGGLYVAPFEGFQPTVEYTAAQLAAPTLAPPAFTLTTPDLSPMDIAFDAGGNLWASTFGASIVVEYTANDLASPGPHAPTVTLSADAAGSLNFPEGIAFDSSGNLWVANLISSTLVEFTPRQLASSGSPVPAVTISPPKNGWFGPAGIAFDVSGNLWATVGNVSSSAGSGGIIKITRSELATGGSPNPAVTIDPAGTAPVVSLDGAQPLAFDANGNLWVGNAGNSSVVEFAANQLAPSGAPIPAVFLAPRNGSLDVPTGLAFDNSGNLWVANSGSPTLVRFDASQLVAGGAPVPIVTINNKALRGAFGIAFNPHPPNLPLGPQ